MRREVESINFGFKILRTHLYEIIYLNSAGDAILVLAKIKLDAYLN